MADVEALCSRAVVVNRGVCIFDGSLGQLRQVSAETKDIEVTYTESHSDDLGSLRAVLSQACCSAETVDFPITEKSGGKIVLRVPSRHAPGIVSVILQELDVVDVSITPVPLEVVIQRLIADEPPAQATRAAR